MPSATASLPSDPQALRALAASLQAALAAKERELARGMGSSRPTGHSHA